MPELDVKTGVAGAMQGDVLAALDSPPPHRIEFGRRNLFRGMVLNAGGRVARALRVRLDDATPRDFPANRPSEDLAAHLPGLEAARNCRFEFSLDLPEPSRVLACAAVWDDGAVEHLFTYDLRAVRESSARLRRMRSALDAMAAPPPEIVFLTQGHRDVAGYRDSIIPGVENMRRYLEACGIDASGIRRLLDFGCGSGRLLTGWLLDGGDHSLAGCDSSEVLAEWARAHLPGPVRVDHTGSTPPLPYARSDFDFVYAVSVLTHLRRRSQELWLEELARVLAPGGTLLLTAHGPIYVRLFAPDRAPEFHARGHVEMEGAAEGSNALASFHAPKGVASLSSEFEVLGYFPEGRIDGKQILFPLAALQDVYVLRRR